MFNIFKFLKSTSVVGINTLISRFAGYIREIFLSAWMGTSAATDALIIATRIPGLLRKISTEGSLNGALIPLIADLDKKHGKTTITNLINKIIIIFVAAFIVIFVLETFFSKQVLSALAPGILECPDRLKWYMKYIPFMSISVIFFFLFGIFSSILNYQGEFFWSSLGPAVWNVCLIIFMSIGYYFNLSWKYMGPIWLIATIAQMFVVLIPYLKLKIPFRITKDTASKGVLKTFFKHFFPIMFSASISQINSIILIALTSFLPSGNTTILHRAERLLQIPIGLIIALNTTLLPTLSQNKNDQKNITKYALIMSAIIFVPISIVFFFWSLPISSIIYKYGKCTQIDIEQIAHVLKIYSLGIPAFLLVRIIPVFFFAKKEVRIPTIGSFMQTAINITICVSLMKTHQISAFAYAAIISTWVNVIFLGAMMIKKKYL